MLVKDVLEATGGKLLSGDINDNIEEFTQDSRKVTKESMYIPLKGDRFDGHDFIDSAFKEGAKATITSKDIEYQDKIVIKVDDTHQALIDMASYIRNNNDFKVVGVTGSVGKTSTRDLVYSVIKQQYTCYKTEGNYNNNIGLPLTLLRYKGEEVVVLEMGMNHLGELDVLSKIAKPDIAVITNVGTAHIGELGSRENILKAKLEITNGMDHGTLIINGDNDLLSTVSLDNLEVLKVGTNSNCDFHAVNIVSDTSGSHFDVGNDYLKENFYIPIMGEHFIINALLGIGVGVKLGIDSSLIVKGIKEFSLTKNRMDIIKLSHDITIIDGSYNASEDSMKSSIDVLAKYKGRKIAVLADMLELGDFSKELHSNVGKYVAKKDIDILVCIGEEAKYIAKSALKEMYDVYHFDTNKEALSFLLEEIEAKDTILVKGSNSMNLKEIVKSLTKRY
ncbi:MAG: UDP-N-acetylmuramoyl-tripeptide--D-alanyl-D-alanine ligase [Thomasclavelia sp.]|nr:UDP-N-acetylmuramoyl-tripeptide--D-alanyl-D-alanine ligase [Thomasclavelia sp.]